MKVVSRPPLGDPVLTAKLQKAMDDKAAKGHVSANYRRWTPSSLVCLLLFSSVSLFAWSAVFGLIHFDAVSCKILLSVAFVGTFATICFTNDLDNATSLGFFGMMLFHLGATLELMPHSSIFPNDMHLPSNAFSAMLLCLGMMIYGFTSLVCMAWQLMLCTLMISTALFIRFMALIIPPETVGWHGIDVTMLLMLVGVSFGIAKTSHNLGGLYLAPASHQFFGMCFLGASEIVACGPLFFGNVSLFESTALTTINDISKAAAYLGSLLLLLHAARTAYRLEFLLDEGFSGSLEKFNLRAERGSCALLLVSAVLHFVADINLVQPSLKDLLLCVSCTVGAVAFAILLFGRRHQGSLQSALALSTLSLGFGTQALARAFPEDRLEGMNGSGLALQLLGSAALAAHQLGQHRPRKWPITANPASWRHLLHPRYMAALGSLHLVVSAALFLRPLGEDRLGAMALVVSAVLFGLQHAAMETTPLVWSCKHKSAPFAAQDPPIPEQTEHGSECWTEELPTHDVDVTIVGAGPTGLMLACILGQLGVETEVLEAREGPVPDARFTVLNSAALEQLGKVLDEDLYNKLRRKAMPDSTPFGAMLVSGMAHKEARVLEQVNTPSRNLLMRDLGNIEPRFEARTLGSRHSPELPLRASQSLQEEILQEQAQRLQHVHLRYGCTVSDLAVVRRAKAADQVLARVMRSSDKSEFVVRSKFVVGCDGPRSLVASKLEVHGDGFLDLAKVRSILVHAPGLFERTLERVGATFLYNIMRAGYGFAGVVATDAKRDRWNFIMMTGGKTATADGREVCREFLGNKDLEVVQDRCWFWNFFLMRRFRHGPAMLAGDAAHSWPPFGAVGGNQGYGDAVNLGWKLAAVCQGRAGSLLLDSYNAERRQAAVRTAIFVLHHLPRPDLINLFVSWWRWPLVSTLFSATWRFLNSGSHNKNGFSQIGAQLGTVYHASPFLCPEDTPHEEDPFCQYTPVVRNGGRLPYVALQSGHDIYDVVDRAAFTLLRLSGDASDGEDGLLERALQSALHARGARMVVEEVSRADLRAIQRDGGARAEAATELLAQSLILVRPDHVVCWHRLRSLAPPGEKEAAALASAVAQTITALDASGRPVGWEELGPERRAEAERYQGWLTHTFLSSLRPFASKFPNAVPIQDDAKRKAFASVRLRNRRFSLTTSNRPVTAPGPSRLSS